MTQLGVAAPAHARDASPQRVRAYATYYGWFDNTPPGCAIAYGSCAGGTGTFTDPISLASDPRELPVGTKVYDPALHKYFVMDDLCQECQADWRAKGPNGGPDLHHFDLWIGGRGGDEQKALACEDALTRSTSAGGPALSTFLIDPPANESVDSTPLFDAATGRCITATRSSSTQVRLENVAIGGCLNAANPTSPSSRVGWAPCDGRASEVVSESAATFRMARGCLAARTLTRNARVVVAKCTGGPGQLWETGRDGVIVAIVPDLCLGESAKRVTLTNCPLTGSVASTSWRLLTTG